MIPLTDDQLRALQARQTDGLLFVHGCDGIVLTTEERDALVEEVIRLRAVEKKASAVVAGWETCDDDLDETVDALAAALAVPREETRDAQE